MWMRYKKWKLWLDSLFLTIFELSNLEAQVFGYEKKRTQGIKIEICGGFFGRKFDNKVAVAFFNLDERGGIKVGLSKVKSTTLIRRDLRALEDYELSWVPGLWELATSTINNF